MNKENINKHGLKRYIEADIRRKIRHDAGYGCVICGNIFVDYEHIEPEFKDAKKHDPEKMTLLCKGCHDDVTDTRISKKRVWLAKENPFSKRNKLVKGLLYPENEGFKIQIGSIISIGAPIFIKVYGKPLFWFSEPDEKEGPIGFNAIFKSTDGILAFIEKNIFHGVTSNYDLDTHGATIEIRLDKGKIVLIMIAKGDEPLKIERFSMDYLGANISFNGEGIHINGVNNISTEQSTFLMNKNSDSCLFSIFGPPWEKVKDDIGYANKVCIAVRATLGNALISPKGDIVGWICGDWVISPKYTKIAIITPGPNGIMCLCNIVGEFISLLRETKSGFISVYPDNKYESGEPIWVSNQNMKAKNVFLHKEYDLSHRLVFD
ncbi:Uncharacterised protein [Klebsiella variicola]|uniref:HNH endonuclease signature motif containing protein n=1 Tax=Klebsiella variicola TaxID=244366 RepID=UPI000D74E9F9|nr:HNH endonuclease [Klebsiella variicola]PXH33308.1 hypothetical protein DMR13_12975 [Klebsiella variicola]SXD75585.1 Uncharacterised protein [Klebsiella variicola]HCT8728667.1 HNH endonuclease [Klebsiella pneumoniae]